MNKQIGYQHPTVPWNGLTVTDLFCGAGGSSSGLVEAGFKVVMAANHWALAIESHQANHPDTDHSQADISQVNPRYFPRTDILWASPECTNHSIAKGVKRQQSIEAEMAALNGTRPLEDEAANRSRATMWDVPRFAEAHKYQAIIVENVVDAYRWVMFPAWLQSMELLGYHHEIVWLNSMHAQGGGLPAPQSRDRMYVIFWRKDRKGRPNLDQWIRPNALCLEHGEIRAVQRFKKAERWGRYRTQYVYCCPTCNVVVEPGWLPALSIIDWSLPTPRIGDRKRPLADKTRERIRKGIERYWTAPFMAKAAGNTYDAASGKPGNYLRVSSLGDAMPTQSGTSEHGLAVPPLIVRGEGNTVPARSAEEPVGALTGSGSMFLAQPLVVPVEGRKGKHAASAAGPMRTQSTRAETGLLIPMRNHGIAKPVSEVIDTVSAEGNHHALVLTNNHSNRARMVTESLPTVTTATTHALLMRNNEGGAEMSTPVTEPMRTLTTGGHQSVIEPGVPISLDVDDAGFRMLEPHEIQAGMGFARDYLLLGTKRAKVKQAGNAVTPPAARDLGLTVAAFLGAA